MPRKAGGDAKAKRRKLAFMERQAVEAAADDADELSGDANISTAMGYSIPLDPYSIK